MRSVYVVPYVGTWIEIFIAFLGHYFSEVVPYVGTWIEIGSGRSSLTDSIHVVPYVGTWIEIHLGRSPYELPGSFPTWERG
mgnify:CR=1 FL=1